MFTVILQWFVGFVGGHAAETALLGNTLTEDDVMSDVKEIPFAIIWYVLQAMSKSDLLNF